MAFGELPQDIQFIIEESPNDYWKREGDDIVTEEVISLKQTFQGFRATRIGVDGEPIILEVDNILSTGEDKRVYGAGMPKRRGGGRGDAIFKFIIEFPQTLTDDQRNTIIENPPDF